MTLAAVPVTFCGSVSCVDLVSIRQRYDAHHRPERDYGEVEHAKANGECGINLFCEKDLLCVGTTDTEGFTVVAQLQTR